MGSNTVNGDNPAAPIWRVELLGGLRVRRLDIPDAPPIQRFRSQRAGALLAYLAHNRRLHTRDSLADHFWPESDPEDARASLRTTLSSLRSQLEPEGIPAGTVLETTRTQAGLSAWAVTTDVEEFEAAFHASKKAKSVNERRELLERALGLYGGALLVGHTNSWLDSWITTEGYRLEEIYFEALRELAEILDESGQAEAALERLRRAAGLDPLREDLQLDLLRLTPPGEEAAALRQFEKWRKSAERAGAEPEARTLAAAAELRRRINAAAPVVPTGKSSGPAPVSPPAPVASALHLPNPVIPPTWTAFFGREEDLETLGQMIGDGGTSLVTILGPGGSGKTRLVLELAHALENSTVELAGTETRLVPVFVPLADLSSSLLIHSAILEALGDSRGEPTLQGVSRALDAVRRGTGTRFVIFLDNFEHLTVEGAPLVRNLLELRRDVVCVVTSRQPLNLTGEQQFTLNPLPVPGQYFDIHEAACLPSVRLFFDRSRRVRPDLKWTRGKVEVVARLCSLLDGLPLAIEIAAARTKVWSPSQIVTELDTPTRRRQAFLDWQSGDAEAPARHRSLRNAIEWSAQQLPATARKFWARLSVFRGGCTLPFAEQICGEENAPALILALREASLVALDNGERSPWGEPRISMLEALREYAAEILTPTERAELERRHAQRYLELAEEGEPYLMGPAGNNWLSLLDLERDNLRAALEWFLKNDTEGALRLVGALWWALEIRGHVAEARRSMERAIKAAEDAFPDMEAQWQLSRDLGAEDPRLAELLRLKALALEGAGKITNLDASLDTAKSYLEEALRLYRLLSYKRGEAETMFGLGYLIAKAGDVEAGEQMCELSVAINRELGNKVSLADSLYNLGVVLLFKGDFARVREMAQERLTIHRAIRYQRGMAVSLELMGMAYFFEGRFAEAGSYFKESLDIFHSLREWPSVARALWGVGNVFRVTGKFVEAGEALTQAMRISVERHTSWALPHLLESFAYLAADMGHPQRAVRLLAAATAFRESRQEPLVPGMLHNVFSGYQSGLREALGPAAFDGQWLRGSMMEVLDAVEFALGEDKESDIDLTHFEPDLERAPRPYVVADN